MEITQETVAAAVNSVASARGRGTLPNMMAFARALKQLGVKVSLSQVIDAARSANLVDIAEKQDFRALLRSNLILQKEDFPVFDMVFDCFWREQSYERVPMETLEIQGTPTESGAEEGGDEEGLEEALAEAAAQENVPLENLEEFSIPTYSPQELLNRKDFSEMGVEESRAIARAILLIATKIATQISRRKKVGRKGSTVDPRWTMRRSMKYGGEIVELVQRKRRIKKTKVVLLCDVSGSMDCYSRFLIQFMYGLQNELWGVETFVFSTSLSRITHLIRTKDIGNALEKISGSILGWSGGTNIGRSLHTFNRNFAPSMVTHRTIVVIISDGWDRGDVSLLEREMQDLKRRCKKIIWLNPLLASDNYEPLCKGMQAALPYLDLFLSVHNVNSLVALGRTLQRMVA
ncbi:MAG: VWA domain-containing protein [Deltaproteobacteria bacterium]|nr:VWA domain-containing protein [Deltaproteobacteria bacterium]MBI2365288.1 VWA domain-containing protein [Deltaproteobacteria bacterium]MBI2533641.1 VWA domain-containing protein [Deltaproteobacteria bacterium]MBI3064435.1 VWA domain-containing protein [Deltaproteobacteria bacterium]